MTTRTARVPRRRAARHAEPLEERRLMSVTFGAAATYGSGSSLGPVLVDLTGGGLPDVVAPNSAGGAQGVTAFPNTDGILGAGVNFNTGTAGEQPYQAVSADFDGDGKQDVATANFGTGISVLFGDGAGSLGRLATYAAGSSPDGIVTADFNGDGKPDLAVSNRGSNDVSVYINNGDGTFSTPLSYAVGSGPQDVAVADLNGDGHPDLATADGNGVSVLLGTATGTFAPAVSVATPSPAAYVTVADMNGDNVPDLVVAETTPFVAVLLGTGTGTTFGTARQTAVANPFNELAVADFNGDGIRDVAGASNQTQSVSVLEGRGNGGFQAEQTFSTGLQSWSVVAGDLNGDGRPDLVVGSYTGGATPAVAVLLNTGGSATTGTYDAAADFSTTANPGGAWTYGEQATEGGAFTAYPAFGTINIGEPIEGWHETGNNAPPFVAINTSTSAFTSGNGITFDTGVLAMHPGASGQYSDVRFTAPAAGTFAVHAVFTGIDNGTGTTTDVHVLHNGSAVVDGTVSGFGSAVDRTVTLTLAAGDTVEFIVGDGGNGYLSDSTSLAATLTPATLVKSIGGLDPSFGTNGLASHAVGFTATTGVAAYGAQSVLVGPVNIAPYELFGVTRYNADGSLDTTFGTGGIVNTAFSGTDAVPSAVAVLPDGDILVAGTATTFAADGSGTVLGSQFALAEYTAAGALDTTFGNGGQVVSGFGAGLASDALTSLAVGPGGAIYVGGSSNAAGAGNADLAIARLTAGGALDATFGSDGGLVLLDVAGGDDAVRALAVQTNGALVAAGSAVVGGVTEVALARVLPTGALDRKFGTKGITTTKVGGVYDAATSVALQPKGQVVVGGLAASGAGDALSSNFLVQRYTAAGKLDRSFGTAGTVVTSFGQPSAVTQVVLQADGSIVASGRTAASLSATTLDVAIARYTTKGKPDVSFAGTGKVVVDLDVGVVPNPAAMVAAVSSALGSAFDAFTSSSQGVVTVTQGGEILAAGNSGENTVEAQLIAAGIDLVTKVLAALPASALGGLKGTATVTLTEGGTTQAAGSVTIQLSFATSANATGGVSVATVVQRVSLKQGQSRSYKVPFKYPSQVAAASYFLVATVTNGNGVPDDLNASNNIASTASAVQIAPPHVALNGSALAASPDTVSAGKPLTVSLTLANDGNVTAKGRSSVVVYLSTDNTTANGTAIGTVALPLGLAAGRSKVVKLKLKLPAGLSAGGYSLLAVLDPANSTGMNDSANATVYSSGSVTVSE